MPKPEALAREAIDEALRLAGWLIQDVKDANVDAGPGVAVREFPLGRYGFADYLLYVDGKAAGVIEAKKAGTPLTGVELQTERYSQGLPHSLPILASVLLERIRQQRGSPLPVALPPGQMALDFDKRKRSRLPRRRSSSP